MSKSLASLLLATLSVVLAVAAAVLYAYPFAGELSGNLVEAYAGGSVASLLLLISINIR